MPLVPAWVWELPEDSPDINVWLRSAPVPAALEYLRVAFAAPVPGVFDGPVA